MKVIPVAGAVVGMGFDAASTKIIAKNATKLFIDNPYTPDTQTDENESIVIVDFNDDDLEAVELITDETIINFRDLPKEVREEKRSEKNTMQCQLLKNENRLKQFALEHSSKPVTCEICGKAIDTNTLSSFQVHAELHSFDETEYFVRENLHIVCSVNCHGKYRNERYRLADGNIYEYDKFERYKD